MSIGLLAFMSDLGGLYKVALKSYDAAPFVAGMQAAVLEAARDWNPELEGVRVLDDPETRKAGARLLAGIAYQVRRAGKGA